MNDPTLAQGVSLGFSMGFRTHTSNIPHHPPARISPQIQFLDPRRPIPHIRIPLPDLEVDHHPLILMLEVVAVEEEHPLVRIEANDHADRLLSPDDDGILPSVIARRKRLAVDPLDDLEADAV